MALLTRFLSLCDQDDTQIFTFVGTKSVTRDLNRDITSKQFKYGSHRWALTFTREDKSLGATMFWKHASEGVTVSLDMTVTLLNRELYRSNIYQTKKRVVYRSTEREHGYTNIISIADLLSSRPRFTDSNGEFLMELSLSRVRTVVEKDFFLQPRLFAGLDKPVFSQSKPTSTSGTIISSAFGFGSFSWTIRLTPELLHINDGVRISLVREESDSEPHTNAMLAKIKYRFFTGHGESKLFSELRQEMVGTEESPSVWRPDLQISKLFRANLQAGVMVRIGLELYSVSEISEFLICPAESRREREDGFEKCSLLSESRDGENSRWLLDTDLHSNSLRFPFYLKDIDKIPRNHLRLVQWRAFLVRKSKRWPGLRDPRHQLEMVEFLPGTEYSHYYSQEDSDTGIMMETIVPTKEIKDGVNEFLDNGWLKVRIIWKINQQLFQSTFHQYDEIYRYQRSQMLQDLQSDIGRPSSSLDSITWEEGPQQASKSRGRRVSSLGDEVYYALDTEGGMASVAKKLTHINIKHQHSLESYQLYKEKLVKIREKQAAMPGWEGVTPPPSRAAQPSPTPSVNTSVPTSVPSVPTSVPSVPTSVPNVPSNVPSTGFQSPRRPANLGGSMPKLTASQPRLNTIQVGLAAIFNPENYIQQQSKKLPFIPGAFSPAWLTGSEEEGLSGSRLGVRADSQMEKTQSNPHLHNNSHTQETSSVSDEDLVKNHNSRRPRPRRLLGLNKCQSFDC